MDYDNGVVDGPWNTTRLVHNCMVVATEIDSPTNKTVYHLVPTIVHVPVLSFVVPRSLAPYLPLGHGEDCQLVAVVVLIQRPAD